MKPLARFLALASLLVGAASVGEVRAADEAGPRLEQWADGRLPVTRGLAVWLDAARLAEARAAAGKPPLADGDPVDEWPDASGGARHLVQQNKTAQPRWWPTGSFAAVRFDGRDDFLAREEGDLAFDDVTIFLVAAPYSAPEWFSALLATSARGKNDFQTGINIDQGVAAAQEFAVLNVEGAGSGGMRNLLRKPAPYGSVVRLCVASSVGKEGVRLWLNGQLQGTRERQPGVVSAEQIFLGARSFNLGAAPQVRGFLDGDVAEVLVYDRALADDERAAVEKYLADKYGDIKPLPIPGTGVGKPLVRVSPPVPVQVLVPGFKVHELPVDLTNVNNVLYRPDGKLVALGYDGNVWLLTDTNGDGLEDSATKFWDNAGQIRAPIGIALTPPNYPRGNGVLVAGKGKVSLLVDTDGDDKADKETIVADGWTELPHGVDALGVAVARDGAVYFGLGTTNFTNAYLVEADGRARYDLKSERGTIVRVAPDFKSRQIVATGIRFPVGLRFNRAGDLFATDQEGATWLANGNPLDELLHIEPERHYGFPPRHPKHLPAVIDEPSVFDYGPQHQSVCGLNFNEPAGESGAVFGPEWWKSDVFVAGYSRGKLYRTKLVKTPSGYVAQNQLLACLNMLTCDACVGPAGELVVACHSGGPDWGSGPSGKGKLYKIRYEQKQLAQPVLAWAASPREVRIAFDRPLQPEQLAELSDTTIEYGRYVSAGDRFESLWPGYKATQDQLRTPRFELPVHSVQLTPDRRTLLLATAPHPEAVSYAVTLPGLGRNLSAKQQALERSQAPEVDLAYNLSGVEAIWRARTGDGAWSGTLPHLDSLVNESLTRGSAEHEQLAELIRAPGKLTLRTTLDLKDMLRPAVQPGSQLDYTLPAERITLTLSSSGFFEATVAGAIKPGEVRNGKLSASFTVDASQRVPLEIGLRTGDGDPDIHVAWHTADDARQRALPLQRLLLPWAPEERLEPGSLAEAETPELKGGNWARGRRIFFGEQVGCAKCHAVNQQGGQIGPDLTNLPHRDYHSVLRDIVQPSFAINPDYITQVVLLNDGRTLTGSVRTQGDKLSFGDAEGRVTLVARDEIEEIQPSKLSVMPEGLLKKLSAEETRDLLTFLLSPPPRMPDYGKLDPPAPRKRAEVDAILAGAPDKPENTRPLKIILVAGRKDHGPGEHDYPAWQKAWSQLLAMADGTTVETADSWPSAEQLKSAGVLVFYQQGTWNEERARDLDAFFARGGGAVYIHYAVDGGGAAAGFSERIGLAWKGGASKFRHGELDLKFELGAAHPIARNFERLHLHDESYWQLVGDRKRITLLATGPEDGQPQPLFWTTEPGRGRVFVSIPGHFSWSFDDPLFRVILLRGIAWTAKEPVDRFNDLVLPGARVE